MLRITTLLSCIFFAVSAVTAQVSLYADNFDASITSLPIGWYATPGSWSADTTNFSTGYTGASGVTNIQISNAAAPVGFDSLVSKPVSTVGYTAITVSWGARFTKKFADSGSVVKFYYSIDGTTWTNVNFTENANNSIWSIDNAGVPIALPANAAGQASLRVMWVADIHYNPSGTYRIDDLKISGSPNTSIENVEKAGCTLSPNPFHDHLSLHFGELGTHRLSVTDLAGRQISSIETDQASYQWNTNAYSSGAYLISVQAPSGESTTIKAVKY